MADIFSIGVSALQTFSRQLETTGHNIANVQTPGFSRQQVELNPLAHIGGRGAGVEIGNIQRIFDGIATDQMREAASSQAEFQTYGSVLEGMESVLSESSSGFNFAVNDFFDAINDLANDPVSGSARQIVLSKGEELVNRFELLSGHLLQEENSLNQQVISTVDQINTLATDIANINGAILLASGQGAEPSDLLDERDRKLHELSQLIRIRVTDQGDGTLNVFTGSGQVLALGQRSFSLGTQQGQFGQNSLDITYAGISIITSQLEGGELGGLLRAGQEAIGPELSELGRIAMALVDTVNALHNQGLDFQGALGGDFFSRPEIQAKQLASNTGSLSLSIDVVDLGALQATDYQIAVNASSQLLITRMSDGATTNLGSGAGPFSFDGLLITLDSGTADPGDRFLIQPGRDMANGLKMLLVDPDQVAAAAVISGSAGINNRGNGNLSSVRVTDVANAAFTTTAGALTPPLAIRFIDGSSYELLDNTNPLAPLVLETAIPYSAGGDLFPTPGGIDHGYQAQISGAPQGGDIFSFAYNSNGVGDNQNALALAGLSSSSILEGGSESFLGAYNNMLAELGNRVFSAENNLGVFTALYNQAESRRDSVSGVNLDEEASNLLRFQQAYEAAAQVIRIADSLFDTLLNAVGNR